MRIWTSTANIKQLIYNIGNHNQTVDCKQIEMAQAIALYDEISHNYITESVTSNQFFFLNLLTSDAYPHTANVFLPAFGLSYIVTNAVFRMANGSDAE